nr:hypothetical protein [Pseudonocardia alni]
MPFDELPPQAQEYDRHYRDAIRRVAAHGTVAPVDHRPGTLTEFTGLCATGDCDHDDDCPTASVLACVGCTITDPNSDAVKIVEWPCEHVAWTMPATAIPDAT